MKNLMLTALLSAATLSAFASTGILPKKHVVAIHKSAVKKEVKAMDCTVTMDCGNGTTVSATASTCSRAGAAAGAGCDVAQSN